MVSCHSKDMLEHKLFLRSSNKIDCYPTKHCCRRLREKKNAERVAMRQRYRGTMERIFSLECYVDLATLRARPSAEFLSFLQMNSAPEAILKEVCKTTVYNRIYLMYNLQSRVLTRVYTSLKYSIPCIIHLFTHIAGASQLGGHRDQEPATQDLDRRPSAPSPTAATQPPSGERDRDGRGKNRAAVGD